MGKKRRFEPEGDYWCFYCDREFEDERALTIHQGARHLKCPNSNKKMRTLQSLIDHSKENHGVVVKKYLLFCVS